MMGRSHLASGVVTGLAVVEVAHPPALLAPLIVAVAAYSALTPDLDHPAAPAARCLGPVSWALCWLVRTLSARTTGAVHRGLTHSVAFATGWGVLVGAAALPVLPLTVAAWTALAAWVGCLTHIAGDVWTLSGCRYVLWPYPVQVSVPNQVRFRTGGPAESVVFAGLVVATVVLAAAVLR